MHYQCTHCGARFTATDERPRCPSCLRITTVVRDKGAPTAASTPAPSGAQTPASATVLPPGAAPGEPSGRPVAHQPPPPSLGSPPWPLWVGVAIMAATLCGVYGTAFEDMSEGERLGAAGTFAALGGAGFALALRGLLKWRPWR